MSHYYEPAAPGSILRAGGGYDADMVTNIGRADIASALAGKVPVAPEPGLTRVMGDLEKRLAVAREMVAELASKLGPILLPELPEACKGDSQRIEPPQSPIVSRLASFDGQVCGLHRALRDIISRLDI